MKDLAHVISLCSGSDKKKIAVLFRVVASSNLNSYGKSEACSFLSNYGIYLTGDDIESADSVLLDCIYLELLDRGDTGYFTTDKGYALARNKGIVAVKDTFDSSLSKLYGMIDDTSEEDDSEDEEAEEPLSDEDFDDEDFDDLPDEYKSSADEEDDIGNNEDDSVEEKENNSGKFTEEEEKEVERYYSDRVGTIMSKLVKSYSDMYQSGYEIIPFAGVITSSGMAKLSGSKVVYEKTSSSDATCKLILEKLHITECSERSNVSVANRVIQAYLNGGSSLLYFPYKMMEFAYGRKSPDGDNQESLNTYREHSDSVNWSAYCKSEVEGSLGRLIKRCIKTFILNGFSGEERFSSEASESLSGFLLYLEMCLSVGALFVDWKQTNDKYGGVSVDAFKIRICDPLNNVKGDITEEILSSVFLGASGNHPYSYPISIKEESFVKEYAHEFDHNKAQAKPLFAYKAYESLKNQGITPDMDNLILGMSSDGRILRNGGEGVTLSKSITHFIIAGSRAGKGVMTLNILASGIASNRSIFYLDRKPDMATVFQHMCPDMFVVNGGKIDSMYDDYGYFNNLNSSLKSNGAFDLLVPNYVCKAFNLSTDLKDWNVLGDLFYLRALRLAIGICVALYTSKECQANPNLSSEDGIMLVVDEFSNFQESLADFFAAAINNIPPVSFEEDLSRKMSGTIKKEETLIKLEKDMQWAYTDASMYAITWLKSLNIDLSFFDEKVKAGTDSTYVPKMDIFVIGQDVKRGPIPRELYSSMLQCSTGSGRYKTSSLHKKGIQDKGTLAKLKQSVNSIGFNIVNFKSGLTDGFFGRNRDDGHSVYLAQENKESKAYGRLDDKASNFAYVKSFSDGTRQKIVSGNPKDNLEIANAAVYFKPFLVLNDNTTTYADQMFFRCAGGNIEPGANWIPKEVIQAENPGDTETGLCDQVGFPGYIEYMGVTDKNAVLRKSGDIANYVVKEVLGYPGSWFEFVMDLRFEWMFSIQDIVEALAGVKSKESIGFFNRNVDTSFDEYNEYIKGMRASKDFDDKDKASAMLLDGNDDYTEFTGSSKKSEADLASLYGVDRENPDVSGIFKSGKYDENSVNDISFDDDDEISLNDDDDLYDEDDFPDDKDFSDDEDFDEDSEDEKYLNSRYYRDVPEDPPVLNKTNFNYRKAQAEDVLSGNGTVGEVEELLERLRQLGYNVSVEMNPDAGMYAEEKSSYEEPTHRERPTNARRRVRPVNNKMEYQRGKTIEDVYDFSDGESIESLENVVKSITKDVLRTFGGLERITEFKCKGESVSINGYLYKCRFSGNSVMSLPYDIRSKVGASCVASLYNYKTLFGMKNLRSLNFDSTEFVYDFVSTTMGYGNRVSVDLFFRDIPSLRELKIGNHSFTRENYKEKLRGSERDMFYQPKLLKRTADFTDSFVEKSFKNSWAWTLDSARNRKYSAARRVTGVVAGTAMTTASGVASAGIKATRKGIDLIRQVTGSFRKALNDYDD